MESTLHFGEDYLTMFDTEAYMNLGWDKKPFGPPILSLWNEAAKKLKLSNQKLLDVGTGPCILSFIAMSRVSNSITLSDYVPANREAIRKWIQKELGAFDWTPVLQLAAEIEGNQTTASDIENRVRGKLEREILAYDAQKDDPFDMSPQKESFDIITTQLCLEAACATEEEFQSAISNLAKFLKPGGLLFQLGCLEETHYTNNKTKFTVLPFTTEMVRNIFQKAGFKDIEFQTHMYKAGDIPDDTDNLIGIFLVRATKI